MMLQSLESASTERRTSIPDFLVNRVVRQTVRGEMFPADFEQRSTNGKAWFACRGDSYRSLASVSPLASLRSYILFVPLFLRSFRCCSYSQAVHSAGFRLTGGYILRWSLLQSFLHPSARSTEL